MKKGLVLCGVTVLFWALYAVYVRYAAAVWSIEPMVFGSVATLTAGLTMLVIAGPGDLGRSTLRDPHTWAYGLLDVVSITLAVGACFFATATELVLLLRVDVVFGLTLAWLVFGRRIRNTDLIGSVAILAGCALAAAQMPPDNVGYAVLLIALASLSRVAVTVISERHPTSNAADTVRKRCRITGMIMLVSALVFLAAVMIGALVYAPATYFYLYAVRIAGTETFFMMLVYQPILTIGLERALRDVTPLPAFEATPVLIAAILCVIGGSTFMLGARYLKRPPTPGQPVPID